MPPVGLPDSVRTVYGERRFRAARPSASVRISLDPAGTILAVDSIAGTSEYIAAVRGFVGSLRFDPALKNGRPVYGALMQTFYFRSARPTGH